MKAQILSFDRLNSKDSLDSYIVIKADIQSDSNHRFCLSPEVMHWRDDIWIIDISNTKRYWFAQSLNQSLDLISVLKNKLKENNITIKKWIHCSHPWQGLFLLPQLCEQTEIYNYNSIYCQNRAKDISWADWLYESECLHDYLKKHLKSAKLQRFQSKKAQLLRAMDRLGLENTFDISEADSSSMQKRFGYWVAKLWEWTFPEKDDKLPLFQSLNILNDFVWVPEKPKNFPIRSRSLEYSVEQWGSMTEYLTEDFNDLLKKHFKQSKFSICELSWTIELYNGESIPLNITFRNPYSIFQDAPEFSIALTQCKYQFDSWQNSIKRDKHYSDFPEAFKIVAWKIEVTKSLFSDLSEQHFNIDSNKTNYFKILELENKLPKALKQYQSRKSFMIGAYKNKINGSKENISADLWKTSAIHRPLFKHKKAIQLNSLPIESFFLERNSREWWQDKHSKNYNQDFFKAYHNKEWKWICKNSHGEIFELGKFD